MRRLLPLLLLAAACARAPLPAVAPLPTLAFRADTVRSRLLAEGVTQRFIYSAQGPWAIHLLEVDLDACNAAVAISAPPDTGSRRVQATQLLRTLQRNAAVIAGVNADFFSLTTGRTQGLLVAEGRTITPPNAQPALAFDSSGRARIAEFTMDARSGALRPFHPRNAVAGRPRLVRDSAAMANVDSTGGVTFASKRHPRTAAGIARDGQRLLLVVVDGRQAPYSDGMTLRELASLMLSLGARDVLNLDGGGSTTMVYADSAWGNALAIANHPSDPEGERAVGDALAIVRRCRR